MTEDETLEWHALRYSRRVAYCLLLSSGRVVITYDSHQVLAVVDTPDELWYNVKLLGEREPSSVASVPVIPDELLDEFELKI